MLTTLQAPDNLLQPTASTTTATDYHEKIFSQGTDYFNAMLQDIAQAQTSIDLEVYIFSKDSLAQQISQALIDARRRDVQVRVLLDGAGLPLWGNYLLPKMERAGIQIKIFHPFPWQIWQWGRSVVKLPLIVRWIYLAYKMNSRNHRKTCVIDNKIAYLGSLNIDKCHLPSQHGGKNWRDSGVRVFGLTCNTLAAAFNSAWTGRRLPERIRDSFKRVRANPQFRLNNNRHRRRFLHKNLLKRIRRSKQRIWITNAYFIPDNVLLHRLSEAAQRKIDVRILLPKKSDIRITPWASVTFYRQLLKSGVRIFEYNHSILHAKTLIIDDWMLIGSSNLNHRSILHDLEVDMHLRTPAAQASLEQQFLTDLEYAHEIPANNWKSRPYLKRLIGRAALYLKYWM